MICAGDPPEVALDTAHAASFCMRIRNIESGSRVH